VCVVKDVRAAPRPRGPVQPGIVEVPAAPGRTGALVADRLLALPDVHRPGDVAVLARVSATLLAPQLALEDAGVPVHRHVGPELLARTGMRTALAYLRCAADPDRISPDDLLDTLRRPARRLTGVIRSTPHGTSLTQLARQISSVDPEHREALHRYVDDLALLATLVRDGMDSTAILEAVRGRIGLGASLDALDGARLRPEGSSHGDDLDALLEVAVLEPDPCLLPQQLARRLTEPPAYAAAGAAAAKAEGEVTLSTIHRVKGREWDAVLLVGLRAGLVPHRLCDDVEEERRVLHVAMTRARRALILLTDPARPSPFLPELRGSVRPAHAPAAADEAALLATLRDWRSRRAADDRVPAFLVAHDRTLAELARRRPRDRAGLLTCHGIGPAKAARFGDELLRIVKPTTRTPAGTRSGTGVPTEHGPRPYASTQRPRP
jgi:DNA helicase-2/ATP-dependent DNA helicase PcrA